MTRRFGSGVPLVRLRDPKTGEYLDEWQTTVAFEVILNDGRSVVVPEGFVTDKASVPRLVWAIIPRDDKHIVDAALVHDYLYVVQKIENVWIERATADDVFRDICERAGMGFIKRRICYRGVRLGGWAAYNPRAERLRNPYYVKD